MFWKSALCLLMKIPTLSLQLLFVNSIVIFETIAFNILNFELWALMFWLNRFSDHRNCSSLSILNRNNILSPLSWSLPFLSNRISFLSFYQWPHFIFNPKIIFHQPDQLLMVNKLYSLKMIKAIFTIREGDIRVLLIIPILLLIIPILILWMRAILLFISTISNILPRISSQLIHPLLLLAALIMLFPLRSNINMIFVI